MEYVRVRHVGRHRIYKPYTRPLFEAIIHKNANKYGKILVISVNAPSYYHSRHRCPTTPDYVIGFPSKEVALKVEIISQFTLVFVGDLITVKKSLIINNSTIKGYGSDYIVSRIRGSSTAAGAFDLLVNIRLKYARYVDGVDRLAPHGKYERLSAY